MNLELVLQDIRSLPPDKQEEVADFIAFLKSRIPLEEAPATERSDNASTPGFFGMWSDRTDLGDSADWVRKMRQQEWGVERG